MQAWPNFINTFLKCKIAILNSFRHIVSMATSIYKRNTSEGQNCRFSRSEVLCPSRKPMNQAASTSHAFSNEKMICVECFRTKGEGDFKHPCQNPRCHFYLCYPSSSKGGIYSNEMPLSFSKEVGHDRKTKAVSSIPKSSCSNQLFPNWKSQTFIPGMASAPQIAVPKTRSKSTSTTSASGNVVSIPKLLCGYQTREKAKFYHSRMMSLPECADSFLDKEGHGDLVEDSFVTSPLLLDYSDRVEEDRQHRFTSETDSGISSPFGRPSGIMDWMDCAINKTSVPISSAVPTLSSNCASTSAFDMSRLKMELPKSMNFAENMNFQDEQLLPMSDRGSPNILKMKMNGIAGILGLEELMQCSETYSRKVFVGGLPPEVDEDDIRVFFMRFGAVSVDWPHKSHSRGSIPPKGYAFLLFKSESSVHKLLLSCKPEEDKHFIYMPTSTMAKKKVQVRPWYIADGYHCVDTSKPIDPRKAVFVGGVPRPLKASELAEVMTEKYGNVALIVIDSDSELKYPKGAACVVFSSHGSYIAAVSARFMQLNYGALDKKIEIKPYVLDGQMCDECTGVQCNGKPAPFFCGSVMCLQYYCEYCWATVHSMPGRQNHRPLLKDIGDKARFY